MADRQPVGIHDLRAVFVYEGIYLIVWAHSERVAYACAYITHARVGMLFSVEINFFQKKEKNLKNFSKMLDIIRG